MTPDEQQRLIGIANQDQENAEIAGIWSRTPTDIKAILIDWIDDSDPETAAEFIATCPAEWIFFLQKCALAGLRGAVLDS